MESLTVNGFKCGYDLVGSGEEVVAFLNGVGMSAAHWRPVLEALGWTTGTKESVPAADPGAGRAEPNQRSNDRDAGQAGSNRRSADRGAAPVQEQTTPSAAEPAQLGTRPDAFARGRRALTHDFRGQLMSDWLTEAYTLEQHADDVFALLDTLEIRDAHLVGTSYGAEIAMLCAIREPRRVKSLVLIDGVSEMDGVLTAAVESWKRAALTDPITFYRSLIPWNYSARFIAENGAALRERESLIAQLPAAYFDSFAKLCDAFLSLNCTDQLSQIICPTLVVVAEQDILKPRRYSEIIADRIAGARMEVVPGSGHAVVIERPGEIARLVRPFIPGVQ